MVNKYRKQLIIGLIALSLIVYLPILQGGVSALSLGRILGLVAGQLIWWQIILGNRLVTGWITSDLVWVNKLHQWLGKYGFAFILFHPILIIASYGVGLVWPPQVPADSFGFGVNLGSLALGVVALVWLTSALLRGRLSWRGWKRLHLLAYLVFPLLAGHVFLVSSSLSQYAWIKHWFVFLLLTFSAVVLVRLVGWSSITSRPYKLVNKAIVARNVTSYRLRPLGKALQPSPGQFAYLQTKRFSPAHPFTISHFNAKTKEVSFSIKSIGPFTNNLTNLKLGKKVFIGGPYGVFTKQLEEARRPVVMIAGGIGITPFIRRITAGEADYLFFAGRSQADIAYKNDIDQSPVKAFYVLSKQKIRDYLHGHITARLIEGLISGDLPDYDFYICGPKAMMKKISNQLINQGVSGNQIYTEEFSL